MTEKFWKVHPFVSMVVADKIRGAVLGAALGDCVGLFTEFLPKHVAEAAYPESRFKFGPGGTKFHGDSHRDMFDEGSWTDDTDHALLIILSYLHTGGKLISSEDLAHRLSYWVQQGLRCLDKAPLGLGNTVGKIVTDPLFLRQPTAIAYMHWLKGKCKAAPNGSLMRTFPLGIICLEASQEHTFQTAARFSSITHPDLRCVVSCCLVTAAIRSLLRGDLISEDDLESLYDSAFSWVTEKWATCSERLEILEYARTALQDQNIESTDTDPTLDRAELYRHLRVASLKDLQLDETRRIGYVYKCLGAAFLSLRLAMRQQKEGSRDMEGVFEKIITTITMEGGDADTNASVAGALIGAFVGGLQLPRNWLNGLKDMAWLKNKSDALTTTLGVRSMLPGYEGNSDSDTAHDGGKYKLDQQEIDAREKTMVQKVVAQAEHRSKQNTKAAQKQQGKGWLNW